jgi:carbon-monoxide dehydrogenase large subunit
MRAKIIDLASEFLEANPLDIAFMDGIASVNGSSSRFLSLEQISQRYLQSTPMQSNSRLLAADAEFTPPTVVYGSGSHCVVLEVLASTLAVKILDYVSVDDCGAMLNPIVVDGQVYGGVVHGVSNSLYEEVVYDEGGYCSNPNLVGYLLASSAESPRIRAFHLDHPTANNPLGVKGVGEGATSSAPAAIANAVSDALTSFAVEVNSLPITPWALFEKMSKTNFMEAL